MLTIRKYIMIVSVGVLAAVIVGAGMVARSGRSGRSNRDGVTSNKESKGWRYTG